MFTRLAQLLRTCPYFFRLDALFSDSSEVAQSAVSKTGASKGERRQQASAVQPNDKTDFVFDFTKKHRPIITNLPQASPTGARTSGALPGEPIVASSSKSAPSGSAARSGSSPQDRSTGKKRACPQAPSPEGGADEPKARSGGQGSDGQGSGESSKRPRVRPERPDNVEVRRELPSRPDDVEEAISFARAASKAYRLAILEKRVEIRHRELIIEALTVELEKEKLDLQILQARGHRSVQTQTDSDS